MPTSAITPVNNTNIISGMTQRLIRDKSALLSLQPIRPKLSSSIVSDQPNAGFTRLDANTTMAADWWFYLHGSFPYPLQVVE